MQEDMLYIERKIEFGSGKVHVERKLFQEQIQWRDGSVSRKSELVDNSCRSHEISLNSLGDTTCFLCGPCQIPEQPAVEKLFMQSN